MSKRKIIGLFAVLVAAFLLLALSLPLIIPSAQDAQVSEVIRKSFVQSAEIGVLTNRELTIVGSPRRGRTVLIVSGNLSDSEKRTLQELADKIGQTNGNRQVGIVFK